MENPRNVIGATGFDQSNSYYNQAGGSGAGNMDENDLYEYEGSSNGKNVLSDASGRVKQMIGSIGGGVDLDGHSTSQYKRDIIDTLCSQINQTLLIPKSFYFFFFAAFGSLFPLMAIYFKQMAFSPFQVGLLFGFRPFVEFLSVPFWANVADKWKKGKMILLGSLLCWIIFTLGVGLIQPPVHYCLTHNETHIFVEKWKGPETAAPKDTLVSGGYKVIQKRSIEREEDIVSYLNELSSSDLAEAMALSRQKRQAPKVIKGQKTTTTTTTTPSTTTVSKSGRGRNRPTTAGSTKTSTDELEFSYKDTKSTKSSAVNKAVDQIANQEAQKNIQKSKSKEENKKTTTVKPIKNEEDDDEDDDDEDEEEISTTRRSTTTEKPVEKAQYFGSDPFASKNRDRIILLNDSALRLIKPSLQTSIVYHRWDVHRIFLIFFFFILAGEFFSAPAITMADTCTLHYLGPSRADMYGRQRMFGSLGWALAMFTVGIVLDHAKAFTDHPCGKAGPDERNYSVCFAIYSCLMGCALIVATQFKFDYGDSEQIPLKQVAKSIKKQVKKVRGDTQFDRKRFENEEDDDFDSENINSMANSQNINEMNSSSTINQQQDYVPPSFGEKKQAYLRLFKLCQSRKYLAFLFVIWFMGIGVGLVFTFLFWHLQDLGGTPALYGFASVINHMSELMAYFFVHQLVAKFGHIKLFYAGLLGNAIRFVYVSLLSEPYWILPFEFIQGITHALVWATATSFFAQSVPDDLRSSAQGVLQAIHFGLGRGCGAIFGGLFITWFEAKITFLIYGLLCLVSLVLYIAINQFIPDNTVPPSAANDEQFDEKEINQVSNPMMQDSNYYYQPSANPDANKNPQLNPISKTSFPIAPHGVPSTNPNWTKQFVSNRDY